MFDGAHLAHSSDTIEKKCIHQINMLLVQNDLCFVAPGREMLGVRKLADVPLYEKEASGVTSAPGDLYIIQIY